MASYTPHYNLKKPADADSYDIADANGNMDIIDEELNTLNGNINNKLKTVYKSTQSFQAIDPYIKTTTTYLGGSLDEDVAGVIGSIPDGMSMRILSRSGPVYSCIINKTSNSYYCGLAWGYHDSAKYTVWLFAYINGTYMLRPMAQEIDSI